MARVHPTQSPRINKSDGPPSKKKVDNNSASWINQMKTRRRNQISWKSIFFFLKKIKKIIFGARRGKRRATETIHTVGDGRREDLVFLTRTDWIPSWGDLVVVVRKDDGRLERILSLQPDESWWALVASVPVDRWRSKDSLIDWKRFLANGWLGHFLVCWRAQTYFRPIDPAVRVGSGYLSIPLPHMP